MFVTEPDITRPPVSNLLDIQIGGVIVHEEKEEEVDMESDNNVRALDEGEEEHLEQMLHKLVEKPRWQKLKLA